MALGMFGGYVHWNFEVAEEEVSQFGFPTAIFSGALFFQIAVIWLIRLFDYELLKSHYENNQTKHEYQTILEHSDPAIVCHAEDHFLKFFNSKGQSIIEKSADMLPDKDILVS